jgi:proton glutamate symport protein
MSFTVRVLLGLLAGLAIGIVVSATKIPWMLQIPGIVEPIGQVFINAIRMAVIPLVVSSLIVGVASTGDARTIGRLGGRAFVWFLIVLFAAAVFAAALAFPLLNRLNIDPAVAASLRESAARSTETAASSLQQAPTLSRWVTELFPVNVFKAATDGAMLPLIVFSIAFGLALTRVLEDRRQVVLQILRGISDGMLTLVGWVLKFTPIGVFALAIPLAARMGLAAAGALIYYIVLLSAVSVLFIGLVLYPATALIARVPMMRFIRACAPSQAVALASRSSLAALPATLEGTRELGLPEEIPNFVIPLSASMFRPGGAIAQVVAVLFVARLYGVALDPSQLATVIVTVVLTTLSIPGVPAGAIIVMAPVLYAVNVPVEGIGVLLGVDTIPDMFRTAANVTGWLGVGSILARGMRKAGSHV